MRVGTISPSRIFSAGRLLFDLRFCRRTLHASLGDALRVPVGHLYIIEGRPGGDGGGETAPASSLGRMPREDTQGGSELLAYGSEWIDFPDRIMIRMILQVRRFVPIRFSHSTAGRSHRPDPGEGVPSPGRRGYGADSRCHVAGFAA